MKTILFCKGERGLSCLLKLTEVCNIVAIVFQESKYANVDAEIIKTAEQTNIKLILVEDINSYDSETKLKSFRADLFILAGFGQILKYNIISIPNIMTINCHAGKLPEMRGSSPMNWALIKGHSEFQISLIKLDKGVDTGDILLEKSFKIDITDTISDLHRKANKNFPQMLIKILKLIKANSMNMKSQNSEEAGYFPLRFPDDGLIIWDLLTDEMIHNKIRALTIPYPCAFTFLKNNKVDILESEILSNSYYGEPGRIYKILKDGIYVGCKNRCLKITNAVYSGSQLSIFPDVKRYDEFLNLKIMMFNSVNYNYEN